MAAPGWITLSADKKTLYVVNNNGNSVTPVDVGTDTPGKPVPVGYFPYAAEQVGGFCALKEPLHDRAPAVRRLHVSFVENAKRENLCARPPGNAGRDR